MAATEFLSKVKLPPVAIWWRLGRQLAAVSNKILSMTSTFGSIYSDSKYRAERSRTSGRASWKEIKHGYQKIMVEIDHDVGM